MINGLYSIMTILTLLFVITHCRILLTIVVEGVCIFLCIYDSALKIFKNTSTTELVLHTGLMGKAVNQVAFIARETVFREQFPELKYNIPLSELLAEADRAKAKWDSLRFGSDTNGNKGFLGLDAYIDTLITQEECVPHELADVDLVDTTAKA